MSDWAPLSPLEITLLTVRAAALPVLNVVAASKATSELITCPVPLTATAWVGLSLSVPPVMLPELPANERRESVWEVGP